MPPAIAVAINVFTADRCCCHCCRHHHNRRHSSGHHHCLHCCRYCCQLCPHRHCHHSHRHLLPPSSPLLLSSLMPPLPPLSPLVPSLLPQLPLPLPPSPLLLSSPPQLLLPLPPLQLCCHRHRHSSCCQCRSCNCRHCHRHSCTRHCCHCHCRQRHCHHHPHRPFHLCHQVGGHKALQGEIVRGGFRVLEPSMTSTYVKYPYCELHGSCTLVGAPLRPPKMYQYILGQKWDTFETTQNVPVHFGSKVRHMSHSPVETAQNVPVHYPPKMYQYILGQKWDTFETAQNVPVHFDHNGTRYLLLSTGSTYSNVEWSHKITSRFG